MFKRVAVIAVLSTALVVGRSPAADLGVGDPAPKLEVKEFVKGDPVTKLAKDKTYVVEFWATWCGPCRASIPHLTELQKKYKDITFIGVSVWEADPKAVKPFVAEMGDKMAYRVAVDEVPAGGKGNEGKMAQGWMQAAGQNGIPTAFIVQEGKIAWIGHPMSMDRALQQVASGKWDLDAARAQFKEEQEQRRKLREVQTRLAKAQRSGDPKAFLAALDEMMAEDPKLEKMLALQKFQLLLKQEEAQDKATDYGKRLLEKVFKDDPARLNALAWLVVAPGAGPHDERLVQMALAAAMQADKLSEGKDGHIADTLARAYFASGDVAKALETQERAVRLDDGKDPGVKERLEQYRKAARK